MFHSISTVRYKIESEIASALAEGPSLIDVEILDFSLKGNIYYAKGVFKVRLFLSDRIKKEGRFEIELDEKLSTQNLKLEEIKAQ